MELLRLLRQECVLAGLVDDVVEALVRVVVGVRVLLRRLPNAILVRLFEIPLHGLRNPAGRQRPAHALEGRHHLEPLDDVLEAQRGNEGASPCLQLHQSS
jgi:hypothetical protein